MKKIIFLFVYFSCFSLLAQRTESYVTYADDFFQSAQYIKAIPVYKAALEKNPNYVKAKYRLAECYRFTLDYESAQYYYGDIATNNDKRYPLAGFYYGMMQKLRGRYSDALTTFKLFQKLLTDENLREDERYHSFYKQAKIEIDGCQLAINQVAMEQPDHAMAAVSGPLNSEYNDYAAFAIGSDDIVCITSARKGGKGSLQNNTFGESFSDLFRFQRTAGGSWEKYDPKDRFESTINTKWGDGSGSFNKDRTKFYYTNCNEDLGDFCHIFVSYLRGGKWTEPYALNFNINEDGFNSRHPNLSPSGDTLFFASDRTGTLGGLDIWMSINAGGENWSPPVHLGKQINTAFNEVSPFYYHDEKVLFFSSDGHRGFGGFDIYIAKGREFKGAEIHNAGLPFNSPRDDIFFFLGDKKGYLSSNREGGVGKFDIFDFEIESREKVIDEVSTAETIAGRNSLFTDDYNFDNSQTEIINQIISRRLSSSFSEVDVYLSSEQLAVYNSLSSDDKDRIDKIVNARIRKMTRTSLRSIRSEDEYYYQQLDADKRKKVDNVVTTYLEDQGLGLSISLSEESNRFYNSENPNDREKLDILISERLRSSANYRPKSINYNKLSDKDKSSVDGIVQKYLTQRRSIDGIRLSVAERVFMRDMNAEKSVTVNGAIKEKLLELSREERYKLLVEDNEFYENLTPGQKESIKGIANAFLIADLNSFDQVVDQTDVTTVGRLESKKVNKVILKLVSNLASADAYRAETLFETGELLAANSGSADETLEKLFSLDRGMTDSDKEAIERFVRSTYKAYLEEAPVFIKPASADGFAIEERVPFYSSNFANQALSEPEEAPFIITDDMLAKYEALPAEKKAIIDRLIGLDYIRKAHKDAAVESADQAEYRKLDQAEKVHVEILAKNFRGDATKAGEQMKVKEGFAFYNNLAQSRKAVINRLVLSRVFTKRNGDYSLDYVDVERNRGLTKEERDIRENMQRFRFQNDRILTENQAVEALDHPDEDPDTIVLTRPITEVTDNSDVAPTTRKVVYLTLPSYDFRNFDQITMKGTLLDNGQPVEAQAVTLLKQDDTNTSITSFTDERGYFEFKVPSGEYKMTTYETGTNNSYSLSGLDIQGFDTSSKDVFEASSVAYFDTNSDQLRSEAVKLLNEVITEYRRNRMRIEIESHTDAVGNAEFNRQLSRRRGNTAFNYLVANGVRKSDLSVVWHGFEKPIASNDNPYGRQLNRRMDIRMLNNNGINFTAGTYFLVRPNATLSSIARSLGVSVSNIVETNGLSSQSVRPYQPLRIKASGDLKADPDLLVSAGSSSANDFVYVVKAGETLEQIARKFNVPEELLMEQNNLSSTQLRAGTELIIHSGN